MNISNVKPNRVYRITKTTDSVIFVDDFVQKIGNTVYIRRNSKNKHYLTFVYDKSFGEIEIEIDREETKKCIEDFKFIVEDVEKELEGLYDSND